MSRWDKLTTEQLQGARYALSVLHTSPAVRGRALELLRQLVDEIDAEPDRPAADDPDNTLRDAVHRYVDANGSPAMALEFVDRFLRVEGHGYDRAPVLFGAGALFGAPEGEPC